MLPKEPGAWKSQREKGNTSLGFAGCAAPSRRRRETTVAGQRAISTEATRSESV